MREESVATLLQHAAERDARAVARLITLIERGHPEALRLLGQRAGHTARQPVIGITGYPGVGKSTLVDHLITAYRAQGQTVAVLAVDPSSPVTGGAILGDRIRMQDHTLDPGVFIRSMGTRGHHGGLSEATRDAIRVLTVAGFDVILVETVGIGQDEVEVAAIADTVVVVVAPGLGDDVQAMKSGILEVAHLVVVNKADRENADTTARDLSDWVPRVLRTVASKGEGVTELMNAIAEHRASVPRTGT